MYDDARRIQAELHDVLQVIERQRWSDGAAQETVIQAVMDELVLWGDGIHRVCNDCGHGFDLRSDTVAYHRQLGQRLPNRCLTCRRLRRDARAAAESGV